MIFNIDKETMPREKIREIQLSRLQDLCRRVYANVPFYRRSFDEKGVKTSDVQSLDDLKFHPFTLKQDMRNNYPYGLFAVPMEMIQRIHASSGTTGKATVVGYTKRDIETWAECAARSLAAAGATANDIVQVSYGYGLFTGGLGAHYGAERLGATVIPMSGGSTKRPVQLMRDFGSMQSPMNAYMLNLGLESLHVRMQRHCANGMAVAKFLEAHPNAVKAFLAAYKESVDFVNGNTEKAAQMIADAGIVPNAQIAAKALPNCNIVYMTGDEMIKTAKANFDVLFKADPTSAGGAMPGDDLYYTGK